MREGGIRGEGKRHQLLVSSLPEQTKKVKNSFWICRRTEIIQKTAATQTGDQKEANTENHNLVEEKPININFSKTSAEEGKTELSLMNCCRLRVHRLRENYRRTWSHRGFTSKRNLCRVSQ